MTGAELIAQERERQITAEGYTPEHDRAHSDGSLIRAAQTYITTGEFLTRHPERFDPTAALTAEDLRGFSARTWPWSDAAWKPSPDPVRNLVKAGALIAAEIDRLQAAS